MIADRTPPHLEFPSDVRDRISWVRVELASADWDDLLVGVDVVHHYAWTSLPASANANPLGDLSSNVAPTITLLDALSRKRKGRIVFASSGGTVYGKVQGIPIKEDHSLSPITAYGAGKVAAEVYLGLYRSLHNVDCRIARISNPFGAGQDISKGQGAATKFLHHALSGEEIVIWGDGTVVRDYVHISDVADALSTLALKKDLGGEYVFNIGSGQGTSLNEIIFELEQALDRELTVRREPARPFDVPVNVLDITRARTKLHWQPRMNFGEGMALTLRDLAQNADLSTLSPRANAVYHSTGDRCVTAAE